MLIALLAVLGVNLWVVAALLVGVLSRKRWVSHQPGSFKGAIRVIEGDVPGLKAKWKRGYGRWVRDILVWTKTPLLFRNELIPADALAGQPRAAKPDEVKRLGKHPTIVPLAVDGGAQVEVAASADEKDRAPGPFGAGAPSARLWTPLSRLFTEQEGCDGGGRGGAQAPQPRLEGGPTRTRCADPEQEAAPGQARDIRGMILLGAPDPSSNKAGSSGDGPRTTDALENH